VFWWLKWARKSKSAAELEALEWQDTTTSRKKNVIHEISGGRSEERLEDMQQKSSGCFEHGRHPIGSFVEDRSALGHAGAA
jgi:hypothetical protein